MRRLQRRKLASPDVQEISISGDGKSPVESLMFHGSSRSKIDFWDGTFGLGWMSSSLPNWRNEKSCSAWRVADEILNCLKRFCTWGWIGRKHLGLKEGWFDESLYTRLRTQLIKLQNWDGLAKIQQAGRLLCGRTDGLIACKDVGRDAAHEVVRCLSMPVAASLPCQAVDDKLLNMSHSICKDFRYAPTTREKHVTCQKPVLRVDGELADGVTEPQMNCNYCPMRWGTKSSSMAWSCRTTMASTLLCAEECDDTSLKVEIRDARMDTVRSFADPSYQVVAGLLGCKVERRFYHCKAW